MKKVDFIIVGAQKGGTTALDSSLRSHPEISMADRKEVHFFDRDEYFEDHPDYSMYHSFFSTVEQGSLIGEATPIYMYWNDAPRRMYEYNPDLKLLAVLRNPVDRAFSHWNMEKNKDKEELPFIDAIAQEHERSKEALPKQHRVFSYMDRGFYCNQIKRIWEFFPKEQTMFIKHDDLSEDSERVINEVCVFLGVKKLEGFKVEREHQGQYEKKMTEAESQVLKQLYKQEIIDLESLLGWDCQSWKQ